VSNLKFINKYKCPCGEEWEDVWDCTCNDKCSVCNKEIEPHTSITFVLVYKHINGITINPREYLLDEEGELLRFHTERDAKYYLESKGITDLEGIYFEREGGDEVDGQESVPCNN
jgi:hypothetical protein